MQDISDSPRSNREICDLDRFSSAIEHKLTCFHFRTFLSVLPSIDFIKIPAFPTKIYKICIHYTINKKEKGWQDGKNIKNLINFVNYFRHYYYCWVKT